ncbi:IQ domain-containing protein K [Mytilus coruscus]|uniref:IQ domain-containing protein K n=1 Tax=Mytilus coruscus TaxID=42192 RepID=A0A6J8DMN7_MYTCO|nr:IQ domain-containing protein K [Mytilus coruscus]
MAVIVKVPEKNLWTEICKDFDSKRPPFRDDDEQSVRTEYIDFDPSKHTPVFYGKMHEKVLADADPIMDIDPATAHPACAGFAFTDKPPASPPPPSPDAPNKDKCSPREYLEHYVFPWLLPALEDMLRQAKKEKCLERKRTKFNALDYLTETLYKKNPLHKDRENVTLEEIPFVKEWLKDHPRPPLPLSLIWTEDEATQIIQNYWRGFLVRKDPEVQELRQWQREWREETGGIQDKVSQFWDKKMPGWDTPTPNASEDQLNKEEDNAPITVKSPSQQT